MGRGRWIFAPRALHLLSRAGPIVVDGKLDEPSWQMAPKSTPFVDIVTGEPAWFDTRVALLWDDEHLYFGFWVEETDVWGTLTSAIRKSGKRTTWKCSSRGPRRLLRIRNQRAEYGLRSVLDLEGHPRSRDRRITAAGSSTPPRNAPWCLMAWAGTYTTRGERWGFLDWDFPGLRTAVEVDGIVNSRDRDGPRWTVELAFPWKGLADIADGRALPPRGGDVCWRIDCSRFEKMAGAERCSTLAWAGHGTAMGITIRTFRRYFRT